MNAINDARTDDGDKLFTPARFDLIIVDEAHRSIFKKYRAIFNYFDAFVVGLTATPRSDVDKSTYDFFDMENDMPTFAYEYETAVAEGYLCDYHCIERLYKIPLHGIVKNELSEGEQQALEDVFEADEDAPDFIPAEAIDRIFFNIDTCRRVITDLMQKGLKIEGGDKLGKTIIFAKNHKHAIFIEQQFNALYPRYRGEFARVIDNYEERAETLIDGFKQSNKYPQIAISVDMLDTGIDVHEILNLVYFKRVMSKIKFWQMFGRGTRLCEDIFGPGEDKKEFYIFDYLGNFEFFRQNPKNKDAEDAPSLAETIFNLKTQIVFGLQDKSQSNVHGALNTAGESAESWGNYIPAQHSFHGRTIKDMVSRIRGLNKEQFQVKQNLRYVEKYADEKVFLRLTSMDTEELSVYISPLIPAADDEESSRRFDVLMYRYMLAFILRDGGVMRSISYNVRRIAAILETKGTIPDVLKNMELIVRMQNDDFWINATLDSIENARVKIRELMYCLKNEIKVKVINVTDNVILDKEGERFGPDNTLENYYKRASKYVEEHGNKPSLYKLKNNEPLTDGDWAELEYIFWHEVGTHEEYEKEAGSVSLGRFARSLTGLSHEAVNAAFSEFLDAALYTEEQIQMVKCIIEWLRDYGTLQPDDMKQYEFFGGLEVVEIWDRTNCLSEWKRIQASITAINSNAERTAA
jgi:type I restriction enzyme R subunit